jgi:dTDP-4-amino-4,6-dideoxygalactose transaminase
VRAAAQLRDLAIFGGSPAFAESLHVGRPNIGDQELFLDRVKGILNRRWLTNQGPLVQEFEHRIAEVAGVSHCVAICNATVALEIVIRATGLGGEVIVPSFTFVATAHALQWLGITPVFCDARRHDGTLDPDRVEALITPRTTGIIGVHLWGRPCGVEDLEEIARRRNLKLIFDAAHAFACSYRGKPIGGFGDAEVFSFHASKFLNSFEVGAISTNDPDLAGSVRLMSNFGFAGYDNVVSVGTNGKMTEVCAAMGLTSLASMDELISVNLANLEEYERGLRAVPGVSLIAHDRRERNNWQYVIVEVDEAEAGVSRDDLMKILWAENVLARRYFYPGVHRMEPYRSARPDAHRWLPNTEWLSGRVLALPTGTALSAESIHRICSIIGWTVAHAGEVRTRLAGLGHEERVPRRH